MQYKCKHLTVDKIETMNSLVTIEFGFHLILYFSNQT
jgi:hypothetical protein